MLRIYFYPVPSTPEDEIEEAQERGRSRTEAKLPKVDRALSIGACVPRDRELALI